MSLIIKPTKAAGISKVGAAELKVGKALAAIEQIDNDIAQIDIDIAALAGADNATLKQILGRVLQGLKRSNNRQRRIIQFLMK